MLRSFRPAQSEFHTRPRDIMTCLARRALIKSHRNLSAERRLDFHRNLWRQKTERAVDVRTKLSAFFRDLSQCTQTPHLKSAGVGKHRAIPADGLVQTAAR